MTRTVTLTLSARTVNGASTGLVNINFKQDPQISQSVDLGTGTQPEAMYKLTIDSLNYAQRVQKASSVPIAFELIVDQLTASQISGVAKCKAANLQPLLAQALEAMHGLTVSIGTGNSIPAVVPMSEAVSTVLPVFGGERGENTAPWD